MRHKFNMYAKTFRIIDFRARFQVFSTIYSIFDAYKGLYCIKIFLEKYFSNHYSVDFDRAFYYL